MVTPTDPLFSSQWHFPLIGNIQRIWTEFTGTGIRVGVYDDGVEAGHVDLAANYDASLHVRAPGGTPISGRPIAAGDGHGTACAGIIGAANNGVGGVGVAYGVTLSGVNIDFDNTGLYGSINGGNPSAFANIIGQAATRFDIMSNSWGATPSFIEANGLLGGAFTQTVAAAFEGLSATGRGGLGTIIVQAAGNESLDASGDGVNASRHTITVAATEADGIAASYSNFGATILVTAPAAAVTTDRSGNAGYGAGDFTTTFNGTSAATPVVSGVVALMLDANAGLGWRDVQNILAHSATVTGRLPGSPTAPTEVGGWFTNAADTWNGGGHHIHASYGYGMVNAFNAVRMAEVWTLFAPAQTSANELRVTSGLNNFPDTVVPEGAGRSFTTTFTISQNIRIEHVALRLDFAADWISDLFVTLTSAEGTTITLANARGMGTDGDRARDANWVFGADHLREELSAGTWTLSVFDLAVRDAIVVRSATLDIYGSANSVDDVYHFTDEYAGMVAFQAARSLISDSDGGTDWLNMAAVTANIVLNLTSGAQFLFNGTALGTLAGLFEHAVTGDGNDFLTGNAGANHLYGMRGDDTLVGDGGADLLAGGAGNDLYYTDASDTVSEAAGQGWDTVITWATVTLAENVESVFIGGTLGAGATGNGSANYMAGNSADNVLNGAGGADTMVGGLGNDIYIADASDTITEAAGGGWDSVFAWTNFTLGANLESLFLIGTTGLWGTGNDLVNILTGSSGNDTLSGAGGADTLQGGAGNDLYAVDASDTVTERAGEGWDSIMSWTNYTLGAHLEGLFLMETAAINGTGNDAANYIAGNSSDNVLNGAGGADTLAGGLGNDIYVTDGLDTIIEAEGQGWDTVFAFANHTLGLHLESLFLGGTGALTGVGNALANTITGNAGDNILNGLGGADTLTGHAGNDLYVVDAADTVVEAAVRGWDSVYTLVSYTLGENLEGLFLGGSDAISGTGNALANYIVGNSGDNTLSGAGGTDVMLGGLGNDLYITDSIDTITENAGEGWDSVVAFTNYVLGANLEALFLAGTGAVNGWGNAQANYISGNAGANVLAGLGGNDTLVGGAGADSFVFLSASDADRDVIADFNVAEDSILLDDAVFAGLTVGALGAGAFASNLSGEAADADDRIIYESDTGHLFFDRDGTGAAGRVHFGTVAANLGITSADFFVL